MLAKEYKLLIFLIFCLFITSCATQHSHQGLQTEISFTDPNRLRFSGKGTGAGMMMMSSMGSMGIAIGVAIDEGIGKDIQQTAIDDGIDIPRLITQTLMDALSQASDSAPIALVVDRYGFKTTRGEGDPVIAELKITYRYANQEAVSVNYPDDWPQTSKAELQTAQFEQLKFDPEKITSLLRDAASKNVMALLQRLAAPLG